MTVVDKGIIKMRTIHKTDLTAIRIDKTNPIVDNLRARLNQSVCHIM